MMVIYVLLVGKLSYRVVKLFFMIYSQKILQGLVKYFEERVKCRFECNLERILIVLIFNFRFYRNILGEFTGFFRVFVKVIFMFGKLFFNFMVYLSFLMFVVILELFRKDAYFFRQLFYSIFFDFYSQFCEEKDSVLGIKVE